VISRNLQLRIAFAVPAIAVTVAVIWRGGWMLGALVAVVGVLGAREVYDFARLQGIAPLRGLGYLAAAAIPFAALWAHEVPQQRATIVFAAVFWLFAVLIVALAVRGPGGRPLTAVAVTVFACLYASVLPSFILAIRHGGSGDAHPLAATALVLLPLAATWIGDSCAMAAGSWFGGPKLSPVISPHKTWAGAVGGVLGALATAEAYGPLVLDRVALHLGVVELAIIGTVVSVAGQVGDAAESLFKREVGLKDSSQLIPGHGGVLDRLDSLYFVLPVSASLFRFFGVA